MEDILKVNNVSKHFKNFSLSNVNVSIKENCITGFIGKNGAGKTTLIKIIIGLIKMDEGSVIYNFNTDNLKDKIGVVLDGGYFYDKLTLNQMKGLIASSYTNWDNDKYEGYLKRFNLDGKQVISTLSKGMTMKYGLCLALSHNADLLIMDEPTSGLDPGIRKELMNVLKEYVQEKGKSVFFSTHITSDLEQSADEVIIVDKGKILNQSNKDELIEKFRLIKGDRGMLTKLNKKDLLLLNKTSYGFSAITNKYKNIKKEFPKVIIERASLEDIFLAITEV